MLKLLFAVSVVVIIRAVKNIMTDAGNSEMTRDHYSKNNYK
jgi:hypothetical protein